MVRNTADGDVTESYVIAGDLASRPANLIGMGDWKGYLAPALGRSGSMIQIFAAYKWILDVTRGDMTKLVMTHDITMTERFESIPTEHGLYIHHIC